ncbi:MAG: TIGR03905 family TSCPD domain-containing protein [Erysipelotrichaceae bacterium]|nr:TIGR03905 family TSCPD domain-containing protein [Erysipelotrichaceae bacterium]
MVFEYKPKGVCSQHFRFEIEDNKIQSLKVVGGCNGNLSGISKILVGMDIDHVIERFSNTTCGYKNTSCPDQIAEALKAYKNANA